MVSKGLISGCLGRRLAVGFGLTYPRRRGSSTPRLLGSFVIPGCASWRRPQMRNCASGNPFIDVTCRLMDSGLALRAPRNDDKLPRSRGANARVLKNRFSQNKGAGNAGMRAAPTVSCAIVQQECAHEHTGQRRASDIPCAMALRLISCSPQSGRARCHCRSLEALASSELDASKRGVRTTRLHRTLCRARLVATSASTASHPTSVTIAIRPSWRDETGGMWR